jgi:hypothetical protein
MGSFSLMHWVVVAVILGVTLLILYLGLRRRKIPQEPCTVSAQPAAEPNETLLAEPRPILSQYARRSNFLIRHWRGDLSLPVSYWLIGWLGSGIAITISVVVAATIEQNQRNIDNPIWYLLGSDFAVAVCASLSVWTIVGTWRSAGNYIERDRPLVWAVLARFCMVLGLLQLAGDLVTAWVPQINLYTKMAFLNDPDLPDYDINILQGGKEVEFSGGIKFGSVNALRRKLDANPLVTVVHLNSVGGRVVVGRNLGALIRERHLTTYVSGQCSSACTLAFLGGKQRLITANGKLGFHSYAGLGHRDADIHNDKADLLAAGLPSWFVERAFATANSSLWVPTKDELAQARVITRVVSSQEYAESATTAQRVADIKADLRKTRLYAVIESSEPEVYRQIIAVIMEGGSKDEIIAKANPLVAQLVAKYRPYASDKAVVELASVVVDEIDQIVVKSADDCYFYMMGTKPVDILKYLSAETKIRELAVSALVVETGANDPQHIPTKEQIVGTMDQIMSGLKAKYGDSVAVFGQVKLPTVDHALACTMLAALFREALALTNEQQRVEAIRYLLRS